MIALVLAAVVSFASTPQQAALRTVYAAERAKIVVERTNVVGKYATVLVSGGTAPGEEQPSAILVERFSFGWQPIDYLNVRSRLDAQELGDAVARALMAGMPKMAEGRPCTGACTDEGRLADIEAIRTQMDGKGFIPWVVISGDYGFSLWYDQGGGNALFKKTDGRWHLIRSGGGAMDAGILRAFGVPESALCPFGVKKCGASHATGGPTPSATPR